MTHQTRPSFARPKRARQNQSGITGEGDGEAGSASEKHKNISRQPPPHAESEHPALGAHATGAKIFARATTPVCGASMFGVLAALGNAGGIFMPWLVGVVADWRDLHWGLAISAVAPFVMVPMLLWMRRAKV